MLTARDGARDGKSIAMTLPIEIIEGNITKLHVDVIVNSASQTLLGGGGVDAAIHRAAGPDLLDACRELPQVRLNVRCPTGEARITRGFNLPARFVIHTVGPVWHGGDRGEAELLASCYRNSLRLAARERGLRSIAFPAISCGAFGYPLDQAIVIALREVRAWQAPGFERVICCCFDTTTADAYRKALEPAAPDKTAEIATPQA